MAQISAAARAILEEVSAPLQLSEDRLVGITNSIVGEFNAGLREAGRPVAMLPTFVTRVSDGTEAGTFLTIELIWNNLRVCEVTLDGANKSSRREKIFQVPNDVSTGNATGFFDYIATAIDLFLKEFGIRLTTSKTPVGISFPFPVERLDLNKAKIVSWGKGLRLQDGPGHNVEELLQEAFDRKKLNLRCGAIVNDTVAVLLSESYGNPSENCKISAIFGAGTNGSYVENTAKITKLGQKTTPQMLVNTEFGAFSNKEILPLTPFDLSMDQDSRKPGHYLFEKLVSWIFLGELVRRILVSFEENAPHALSKSVAIGLEKPGSLNSRCLPLIEETKTNDDLKKVLAENGLPLDIVKGEDAETIRWVSRLVSSRAINLCACAIAALITQSGDAGDGKDRIVVALAGEMVFFYPQFKTQLRNALKAILGQRVEKRITFLVAEDAEAIGAALGVYEMERRGRSKRT